MRVIARIFADSLLLILLIGLIAAPVSLSALVKVFPTQEEDILASSKVLGLEARSSVSGLVEISSQESGSLYRLNLNPESGFSGYQIAALTLRNRSDSVRTLFLRSFSYQNTDELRAFFERTGSDHLTLRPGQEETVTIIARPELQPIQEIYLFVGER